MTIARGTLRHAPPRALRLASRPSRVLGPEVGAFEREDAPPVRLLSRHRDRVKSWRYYWRPIQVLLELRRRATLPPALEELYSAIAAARTLPVDPHEVTLALVDEMERFPEELRLHGGHADAGAVQIELVPAIDELRARAASYRSIADGMANALHLGGVELAGSRLLDVGTGSGYLAHALAGLGADAVVGIDLDPQGGTPVLERSSMVDLLAGDRAECVRLERADVTALDEADGSFDAICSNSAIEHFVDLPAALAELHRVLRPGGLMRHGVDPWFGVGGGHSLCTLDFPWGHARVYPHELDRYLDELRPYEAAEAKVFNHAGFQTPRRTLDESRRLYEEAGFEIVDWREVQLPLRSPHRALADRALLADCRRYHPGVTLRDLVTITYLVMARRR